MPYRTNGAPPVRRIRFAYPKGSLRKHYVEGDLVMSHVVSGLSAVFPEGEDFFIRSVKHYRNQVADPELSAQVSGFIGQEVTHGREHRALNDKLQEMGYPTRFVDRRTKWGLAFVWRFAPKRYSLAITAALEHYTATMAEALLTKPEAQVLLGDNEVRNVLLWHALEESEHKAVAFDVYRAVGGTERMRIWAMRMIAPSRSCSRRSSTRSSRWRWTGPATTRSGPSAASPDCGTSPFLQPDVIRTLQCLP